jgi:hypothetical protein
LAYLFRAPAMPLHLHPQLFDRHLLSNSRDWFREGGEITPGAAGKGRPWIGGDDRPPELEGKKMLCADKWLLQEQL